MSDVTNNENYNKGFYENSEDVSSSSAREVLAILFEIFDIQSVVDFGCGTGSWLRIAKTLGATRLTGLEGAWVSKEMLVDKSIELITTDLEQSAVASGTYDLAISVEVGEHLTEARADSFVRDMCAASNRILFGAAIPGQGGTSHINEQWQSYWAQKFSSYGYLPLDVIRPQLYSNKNVIVWYRNNPLLYVKADEYSTTRSRIYEDGRLKMACLDFVIPDVYDSPGLKHSLRIASQIPWKFYQSLKWRARIGRWRV